MKEAAQCSLINTTIRSNPILSLAASLYHFSKHFSNHILNNTTVVVGRQWLNDRFFQKGHLLPVALPIPGQLLDRTDTDKTPILATFAGGFVNCQYCQSVQRSIGIRLTVSLPGGPDSGFSIGPSPISPGYLVQSVPHLQWDVISSAASL